jgi:pimeloyl-ACP methyl ester carboxylesterase
MNWKLCASFCLLFLSTLLAQIERSGDLFVQLKKCDSLLFDVGYNQCDVKQFENLLSADFEFYHDKAGVTSSKADFVSQIREGLCKMNYKAKRELIRSSLHVFSLKKGGVLYGAIQNGDHNFYAVENNASRFTGTAKFSNLWLLENGDWRLSRSFSYAHEEPGSTKSYGNNASAGNYKKINGINLYYETYGEGKPLVLLHGNGGSIRGSSSRIEYLKNSFKVIAVDSRAHGKSLDPGSTLTYSQMANDVATLLDSLKIDSAFVFGQSDGGILGLLLAIHHPKKVARIAGFGANIFPGSKAVYAEIDQLVRDSLKVTKDKQTIKMYSLLANQPNIGASDLKKITCPVLIMCGDRDVIRPEHSLEIFRNISNCNLFIMPGATHFGAYEKPELFRMVLMDFLTRPFSTKSSVEVFTGKKEKK